MPPFVRLALLVSFTLMISSSMWSCDCKPLRSVEEEIKASGVIFEGTVIRIDSSYFEPIDLRETTPHIIRYIFELNGLYKGFEVADRVVVATGKGAADCGIEFKMGGRYIIYAQHYRTDNRDQALQTDLKSKSFFTSSCTRTRKYSTEEITNLEKHLDREPRPAETIFVEPEKMPEYVHGGDEALITFLTENTQCPDSCIIQGTVFVSFVVNEKGKVQDVRIAKGLSSEHDAEAKRVVQLLEYKPGESNGKPVAMKMNLPIRFRKKT